MHENIDFSWLHLSDFHIGKDTYAQNQILGYIIDEIKASADSGNIPDLVFITGDLANRGKAHEYKELDEKFITPMMDTLGDSYFDRVFIVPGNHDVDQSQAKAVMRYGVLDEVENFLDPTPEGLKEREPLLPRFEAFYDYAWYFNFEKWPNSSKGYYTKKIGIRGHDIGILCLNTSWFCGGDGDRNNLSAGIHMLEQGLNELTECAKIIIVGHHPIDWFIPSEAKKFRAIAGSKNAIYLHGHMHKTDSESTAIGNNSLTTLQAGCAFDSRKDDLWLTRILWAGYDFDTSSIYVKPQKWVSDNHNWAVDTEAYSSSLKDPSSDYWIIPEARKLSKTTKPHNPASQKNTAGIIIPNGWEIVDKSFLEARTRDITDEEILQYFEGRVPSWAEILSNKIPSRKIVAELLEIIQDGIGSNTSQLTLLLGAGGEGKSTAFLQTVKNLASNEDINVIWRHDPDAELPMSFISKAARDNKSWVIVSDEGDTLVKDTEKALRYLRDYGNVHIFLTCRDTDWIESRGTDKLWQQFTSFTERKMRGLIEDDARSIVRAWAKLGSAGLGKLSDCEEDEAIRRLVEAAQDEEMRSHDDGAFLGAMLQVRIGEALKDHVAEMMVRLESRNIKDSNNKTLLDAFALISAPHAHNILYLSRSVLARALEIEPSQLRRRVITPLGEEAAAVGSGNSILTRHRAIAEAASAIAESKFDLEPQEILVDLVKAALESHANGDPVPHLGDWRYLSSKFFQQGNKDLGIRLAKAAVDTDPTNSFLIVKLSQLYREIGQPELGQAIFRRLQTTEINNRAHYTEWSTCEAVCQNHALAIYIRALSISDGLIQRPPDLNDIGFGLAGALTGFLDLYNRYGILEYLYAAFAADQIARRINLPHLAFEEINQHKDALEEAPASPNKFEEQLLNVLVKGFQVAYENREENIVTTFQTVSDMNFQHLLRVSRLTES